MNRHLLRRLIQTDLQNLLEALSDRQHLRPHEPLTAALEAVRQRLAICPDAVASAVAWLQLDGRQSIGRLRRTELMQVAQSIHRFWRQRPSPGLVTHTHSAGTVRAEPTERRS